MDVLARDLWGVGEGNEGREWPDLCSLWKGVRVLKIRIKGSPRKERTPIFSTDGKVAFDVDFDRREEEKEKELLNVQRSWIRDGLLRLGSLRVLELGIEDEAVGEERKRAFCGELEWAFGEERRRRREEGPDGWEGDVKVSFIPSSSGSGDVYVDEDADGQRTAAIVDMEPNGL